MQRGVQRWIVDISEWNPSPSEFTSAVSVLPQHEHSSITRYLKMEDRKRAFVSRLLQYAVVHEVLGIPFYKIMIRRTVEGKPYLEYDKIRHEFPNFNFSVSHHGDFVAIASEPLCLVGLDIVSHVIPVKETIPEFIDHFTPYFSSTEWSKITNSGTCDNMLEELYRYWSLKEAFVKAIGSGLGYSLDALEFHHHNWTNISLKIHGKEVRHWRFWHFVLRKRHYVSIARGHPHMATESYKKAFGQIDFEEDEYNVGFNLPAANFMWKTIEQIIPC
uniref:holo-[acyl-carrier-protein] synthase n=1 Tax=Opuntia streptacantha TaxID=393608 RepID=A0A7C9D8L9_OPUST